MYDATPACGLKDLVIGKTVVFDGVIEPRKAWLEDFEGVGYRQTWQLVVTLPSGETVEIGDRLLVESHDFLRCLVWIREKEAVKVRVVGQVADAEPYRRPVEKRGVPPRDVTGKILVLVEQLELLGHHPAEVKP